MDSLLNGQRPPVFCPGCAHDRVAKALDMTFQNMGLQGQDIVIVSDIGCSGLFDTFFNTHAFHGLHGRALTYAIGLKMARPELNVIVTMGDGGLGIGGAHLLSACRRNNDLTLLVLNNFNYGMTGGQASSTTPPHARVGSGFLNQLEKPIDVCQVAEAAGAGYATRCSAYAKDLPRKIENAIQYPGFAIIDMWGVCPGRYTKRNKLSPAQIDADLAALPPYEGPLPANDRPEYGQLYRKLALQQPKPAPPVRVVARIDPPDRRRREIVLLGSAGQRIVTAGEILCLAGLSADLHASQKNDYPITVLRGHSISEVVLSPTEIDYTGIVHPAVVLALAPEGVARRQAMFATLGPDTLILHPPAVGLPPTQAETLAVDLGALKIRPPDWALAALAVLAHRQKILTIDMLEAALTLRFKDQVLEQALALVRKVDKPELQITTRD
jgi:pyruvate/2-oxoacid:ferredoxin oxidoreductase beta subunit/Pyruvate/2-oxoacid:ferredoxin oxidoreductase gamma subunit